jgi:hypothetical protein
MNMHILCLGFNCTSSPIQLRERLIFDEEQIRAVIARRSRRYHHSSLADTKIFPFFLMQ